MRANYLLVVFLILATASAAYSQPSNWQQRVADLPSDKIAQAALEQGDAARGAVVFYQQALACTKCHGMPGEQGLLGPDLSSLAKDVTNEHLVESILRPSQVVHEKYRAKTFITQDGRSILGMEVARNDRQVQVRQATGNLDVVSIPLAEIEEEVTSETSLMPEGQINMLATEEQFLDLVRYLFAIRDGGAQRALELQPSPELYAAHQVPEYEARVDHAQLISSWDKASADRGSKIYLRVCANCHGTTEEPGSLPTSLKFHADKFKQGADPYKMYHTLTHGYGLMAPQTWMVPKQKYDVIHYIREKFIKPHNPEQYVEITDSYLQQLPAGDTLGPEPVDYEPWVVMNYGPNMNLTLEVGNDASNLAYKGIAVRLDPGGGGVSRGGHWMMYEHDTMRAAAGWSGREFIDWNSIHFNGRHAVHPKAVGAVTFETKGGPGWAKPGSTSFEDPRFLGRDERPYGPLPRDWAKYRGIYHHGDKVIVSYTVGETEVLEMPRLLPSEGEAELPAVFARVFNVGPRPEPLTLKLADAVDGKLPAVGVAGSPEVTVAVEASQALVSLPAGDESLQFTVWLASDVPEALRETVQQRAAAEPTDLSVYTQGGPARWPRKLDTVPQMGDDGVPFATDVLSMPTNNPWNAQLRLTGLDFYEDGARMAVCSWDGDVWIVDGIDDPSSGLTWQRIASGMFQPLGLKIVEGEIFVTCRDALYRLHDLNGDGETDFYESFNSDHQVTEHFHEFAMGLQTDDEGNFYYAKSARHAKTPLVPHHGTLLKVSADGAHTEIIANGFRAANGVCLNPDGTFIVTDQEGHWNPKNRINYVRKGGFYGNMWSYTDVTDESDEAMEQPLCWITNSFDRSPAELLWVDSPQWGPLNGQLLNLSYGYGKVYVVPHEKLDGQAQGGMCELPGAKFPTGVHRGRFHPRDGQLYLCGMFAWAGSASQPGGLYRLRYTGQPAHVPLQLEARQQTMRIVLSEPVAKEYAENPDHYHAKAWDLKRTKGYGSKHFNERELKVTKAELSKDGRAITLTLPEIAPTWGMEIKMQLETPAGQRIERVIHNTIHQLGG